MGLFAVKMLTLLLLSFATIITAQICENGQSPRVRQEWSQLSEADKTAYIDAILRLVARPFNSLSFPAQDPNQISYYDFVATHTNNAYWAHGNAQFYVYHRAMMWQWELALNSVGWNKGAVYWDWGAMANNWWTSDIFDAKYFGSVHSTDPDKCLTDGRFAKGKYNVSPVPATGPGENFQRSFSGDPKCLRRCGQRGNSVTDAATNIMPVMKSATNYVQFATGDTSNFHATGHFAFGGEGCSDMGNPYFSPNDPIFWFHHAYVDKIYWRWQQLCPAYLTDYQGNLAAANDPISDGKSSTAYASYKLDSWTWWTVANVTNSMGGVLCYTYSATASDSQITQDTPCPTPAITKNEEQPVSPEIKAASPDEWLQSLVQSLVFSKGLAFDVGTGSSGTGSSASSDMNEFRRDDAGTVKNTTETKKTPNLTTVKSTVNVTETHGNGTEAHSNHGNWTVAFAKHRNGTNTRPKIPVLSYNKTDQSNGVHTVSFSFSNKTIEVRPNCTVAVVYSSVVKAYCKDSKGFENFFEDIASLEYVKDPTTPDAIPAGMKHECLKPYPIALSAEWLEKFGLNVQMMLNNQVIVKQQIDEHNRHCVANSTAFPQQSVSTI